MASCSLALQDGQPTSAPIALEGPGANCLDRAILTLEEFFAGETTQAEIDSAWKCASSSLALFKTHVRGQSGDGYTALELRSFIERYFLTEHKISDGLLTEGMRLKQAILGGSLDKLTRAELDEADRVINTIRIESVKILPYMKVLTREAEPDRMRDTPEFVERAIAQLVGTSHVMGTLLGKSVASYRMTDIERLLKEFGKFYLKSSGWDGPKSVVDQLPMIAAFKAFFIRPGGDSIAPDEWHSLISGAGRLYGMWLRYEYLVGTKPFERGDGLRQIVTIGKDLFLLLEGSIRAKEGAVIRFREIDGLLEQLYKFDSINPPFKEATARQLLRHLLQKACNPQSNGQRGQVVGLSSPILEWLKRDFFGWAEIQDAWDQVSQNGGGAEKVPQLRARFKDLRLVYADSAEEMRHILEQPQPLSFTRLGTVKFGIPVQNLDLDRKSWSSLNWKRLFIRVVVRGYAKDHGREKYIGLKKTEFKAFYDDVFALATEMGILDPRNPDLWNSLFEESNIFMPSANGDDRLSFSEAMEIFSFALSSGQYSRPLYRDLRENCRNFEPDIFGLPTVDVHCYRRRFYTNFGTYYKLIPGWVQMVSSIAPDDYEDFQEVLEVAARRLGYTDAHLESSEIDKVSMLFHYIESLFTRFDVDRNNSFSVEESMAAYPLLKPVLKELSGFKDEKDLTALFTYIVKYGESPDSNIWQGLKFVWWRSNRSRWKYDADRAQILKVIANLQSAQNKKKQPPPPQDPVGAGALAMPVRFRY
ncbi:MAG: hypothetical protein NDI61_13555 [Bdellovibrionaceae bacterium]|nr:hypothetical protein [Pseudobdellovibrionaceae bacterium]